MGCLRDFLQLDGVKRGEDGAEADGDGLGP